MANAQIRTNTLPSPSPAPASRTQTRRLLAAWRDVLLLVAPEKCFGVGITPEGLTECAVSQTPLGILPVYRLNLEAANGITTRDGLLLRLYTLAVHCVACVAQDANTEAALFAATADAVSAALPRIKRVALRRYPLP
jgi:hypothetical protein